MRRRRELGKFTPPWIDQRNRLELGTHRNLPGAGSAEVRSDA
jgi:hypothetical protein